MFLGIIRNIKNKIAEAYQACAVKGATLPESKKLVNLASTILAIDTNSDGVHPTGSKTITSNGTHDVFMYAEAIVDVPGASISDDTLDKLKEMAGNTTLEGTDEMGWAYKVSYDDSNKRVIISGGT